MPQVCKKRMNCDAILLLRPISVAVRPKNADLQRIVTGPATEHTHLGPKTCTVSTMMGEARLENYFMAIICRYSPVRPPWPFWESATRRRDWRPPESVGPRHMPS